MENISVLRELTYPAMLLRIGLAMLVGGIIGLERERKNRGAGFRTYMLVALGASLTVILSLYLNEMLYTAWNTVAQEVGIRTDVSRFGAQVINGVGFLGAGTIIVTAHQQVKGLTTAAGLWASACVGLAAGAGFYECVLICLVLIILIMRLLPIIENAFLNRSRYMNVNVEMDGIDYLSSIIAALKGCGIQILDIETDKDAREHVSQIGAVLNLRLPQREQHEEIITMLSSVDGVIAIDEI